MRFFDRYFLLCQERGLQFSSQEMANRLGVTRAAISSWKVKGTLPSAEVIVRIANTLDTSCDYLLGRTDEKDPEKMVIHNKPYVMEMFEKLDTADKIRVEGYIEGVLSGSKYKKGRSV